MITKIEIKNTATYQNETLDNLNKINFIYGNNGSGKTTITRIINNEIQYPSCKVHWKNNQKLEPVVYNSDFIEDNFGTFQNEVKGIFTLGKEEVETKQNIKVEKDTLNQLNDDLGQNSKDAEDNNQAKIDLQTKYTKEFWKIKQNFDKEKSPLLNLITGAKGSKEIFFEKVLKQSKHNTAVLETKATLEEAAKKCFVSSLEPINTLSIIDFSQIEKLEQNQILGKPIIGKEDIDIAALIKVLNNSDWVKAGTKYLSYSSGKCPFCQQELPAKYEEKLNEYFDETYENDKNSVFQLKNNYTSSFDVLIRRIQDILSLSYEQIKHDEIQENLNKLKRKRDANLVVINKKLENLSQKFSLDSVLSECNEINFLIESSNSELEKHNEFIKNVKTEKKALEPKVWKYICNELKLQIDAYNNRKYEIDERSRQLEKTKAQKEDLKRKHELKLSDLESQQISVKPTLERINKLLADFNFTGFKLELGEDEYSYKIVRLDGTAVERTLSEGEKSFVTFLYFYNLLNGSQSSSGVVNNRIVVIDDPVSSLDNDILFIVSTLIRMMFHQVDTNTGSIKQFFLFSHNTYFFNEVTYHNGYVKNYAYYVVKKHNNISQIINKGKDNPISSSYELLWGEIRNAKQNLLNANIITIQNSMRRILEYYFQFLGGIDIKNLHKNIILKNKSDISIYRSLMSWVNSGSHSTFDDCFYVENDSTMLKQYMDMFELIFKDSGNEAHYQMMINKQ